MSTPIAPDFEGFPKIGRLNRDCVITEKLDGSNAQIWIGEGLEFDAGIAAPQINLTMRAGSRNQWVSPGKSTDNFGFAAWVEEHREELFTLGPGRHFGEWWGRGINRGYGLEERRFSLFNVMRWCPHDQEPLPIPNGNPKAPVRFQQQLPRCCGLVPVLYRGPFKTGSVDLALDKLICCGSSAAPGFANPEGIVIYHPHANVLFKVTVENDGIPKSLV